MDQIVFKDGELLLATFETCWTEWKKQIILLTEQNREIGKNMAECAETGLSLQMNSHLL